jgi:hypothetical protein
MLGRRKEPSMTDPTTEGFVATPAEIEGMVRNLCAYALSEPDPLQRYVDLTYQQVLFEGIAAAIRGERGRALADLVVAGMPVAEVAAKTKLATAPRVRKLISVAGETERVKAATARRPAARTRAKKAVATPAAEAETTSAAVTPPPAAAPTGKRVLTAAERVALGLPADGPIPRARPRRRKRASA